MAYIELHLIKKRKGKNHFFSMIFPVGGFGAYVCEMGGTIIIMDGKEYLVEEAYEDVVKEIAKVMSVSRSLHDKCEKGILERRSIQFD